MFVENHRSVTYQAENGEVKQKVVDMDKNSYVVLTPEFVKGKPALQQMYDKMQRTSMSSTPYLLRRALRETQTDRPNEVPDWDI